MELQKNYVNAVQEEMLIIKQNKHLIEMFLQKIKDRIAEVWSDKSELEMKD